MWYRIVHFGFISFLLITLIVETPGQAKLYAIQISAVERLSEAQALVAELKAKGLDSYLVLSEIDRLGPMYRIRIGQYKSSTEARSNAEKYRKMGLFADFFIAKYEPRTDLVTRQRRTQNPAIVDPPKVVSQIEESVGKEARPDDPGEKSSRPRVTVVMPPKPIPAELRPVETDSGSDAPREAAPRIAGPLMADALLDINIKNPNWKAYPVAGLTTQNLHAIFFIDALTGWIAGDEGALFRTNDGGMNWRPQITGTRTDLNLIHFIDWNTGWMIGNPDYSDSTPVTDGSGKVLLLTNDGGKSWRQKRLPNVTRLFFIDAQTGWAVGRNATILKTTDGGEHWEAITDLEKLIGLPAASTTYNYGFNDIYFLDAERGWLIGNFYGRERNNIGGLFSTTDGGRNWRRIPLTLETKYSSGRFTPGLLHSIHFSDSNTGSLTGEMMDGEGRFFFVLQTRDGGGTWQQYRTPSNATHCTQFIDMQNGWTAAFAPREGTAEAVIYDTALMKTDNGGMSWQNEFLARGRRISALFFLSPNKGWAVGDRGIILKYEGSR